MEFNEKLQELRKQKGLTQEELAQMLYVSRTAISKWESGRGYPSIDSIKQISRFFSVTVDELLSSNEVLNIAEQDNRQKESRLRGIVYGLLDVSVLIFFFLPIFGLKVGDTVKEASLLLLDGISLYLHIVYLAIVIAIMLYGILTLVFQSCSNAFWTHHRDKFSLGLNAAAVVIFTASSQPYAATVLFVFLTVKALMLIKWR